VSTADQERLDRLERRLRELEDDREIRQLVASYGPAVDTGDAEATAALWTTDGSYDVGGMEKPFVGAEAVGNLVTIPGHQGYLARGCAHVMSAPVIHVDGDRATANCYSRLYLHDDDHWVVARVSSNRWELERTADGWRVARRENRLLDGDEAARALLRP